MLAPTPEEKKLASTGTSHAASASTSHQLPPRCICIRWWQLGAPSATTRRNAKHHSSREAKKRTETHASHHQFRPRLKIKKKKSQAEKVPLLSLSPSPLRVAKDQEPSCRPSGRNPPPRGVSVHGMWIFVFSARGPRRIFLVAARPARSAGRGIRWNFGADFFFPGRGHVPIHREPRYYLRVDPRG